jgi:two-component system invasion response regulator UvrY
MIKVLLVDHYELIRSGIESLLNSVEDIEVIGVCDCGEQILDISAKQTPDVILLDINMPLSGISEACKQIVNNSPSIKIIGLSIYSDGPIPPKALHLGIEGFISKGSPVSEMIKAIRAVISGKRYLCQNIANKIVFETLLNAKPSPFSKLSRRESEVMKMILEGKNIQEMSQFLKLSDKTINTYRYRLYSKLAIKNDVELTRLAIKFNYIEEMSRA